MFISRSQNLKSEFNDQPFAEKASDDDKGGFVYNPLDQDNAKSDKRTAEGGLRSEGGMTYAGLKSFLYAGVGKDDPRVKAAVAWVRKHYTRDREPRPEGRGPVLLLPHLRQGDGCARRRPVRGRQGRKHDWRQELFDELKKRQKDDGSWANTDGGVPRKRPGTGDGVRAAGAQLLQEEVSRGPSTLINDLVERVFDNPAGAGGLEPRDQVPHRVLIEDRHYIDPFWVGKSRNGRFLQRGQGGEHLGEVRFADVHHQSDLALGGHRARA